jgi:hypothetical protein
MKKQAEFEFEQTVSDGDLLRQILEKSDLVLIKKLSNNDRNWARYKTDPVTGEVNRSRRMNNQAGVYIPVEQRDGGFFPAMALMPRDNPEDDEIREVFVSTIWPQVDGRPRKSRLVHYTSKGPETHLTGMPRELFELLLPASFIVMGRVERGAIWSYECMTIDSGSDEAGLLASMFGIDAEFVIRVFEPAEVRKAEAENVLDFAEQVIAAWLAGNIASFARERATMPVTAELARIARSVFMERHGIDRIDPFSLAAPGDALREISRSIEWDIFREYQRRERSLELVRLVLGDTPTDVSPSGIIRKLIDEFAAIDALMLSASQQRKARAGYSYEHHIEAMLAGGDIPFEKQVILASKKRPDFILPSLAFIDGRQATADTGLILSAKTTLRERWKQVEREKGTRRLFLTTVDENIAGNAIEDMASFGVYLVIPESLLESKSTEYSGHSNVLSFADFCANHIRPHLAVWRG